jgi:hypothetical protein
MAMKFGSFTYQPEQPPGFDVHVLRVKPETGLRLQPNRGMYSNIAVFADNVAVDNHPDWISQSSLGPAKMGNNNYNIYWDIVCATQPEHRAEQLSYIANVDRYSPGVMLNSQYFADHGHCTCSRCKELYSKSGLSWLEWRRKEVTDYIAQIREVVKKDLILAIQPDPVSSYERYGVDFDDLAKYADAFNVVMFSKNYATPWYWEMISRGFKKLLKKPFYVSFYVFGPGDNPKDLPTSDELLTVTVRCARTGVDGFLYLAEGASQMLDFQKAVVKKTQLRERLKSYGGKPVQDVLERITSWEKMIM